MTRVNRIATTARLVLFMKGSHNSWLGWLRRAGAKHWSRWLWSRWPDWARTIQRPQATTVAACFEGLLLHRIARHDETDPRPTFGTCVRAALD